jgi:hypothetical protein
VSTTLTLIHAISSHIELHYQDRPLVRYVYAPATEARESPRPYFHPLFTLAGNMVTIFRPHDHPWHHGLAMTCAHLSGQNFWGGPTYVRGRGYVPLENNGQIVHQDWEMLSSDHGGLRMIERLTWITAAGETWLTERRGIAVTVIDPAEGYWVLDLAFALTNVAGRRLEFGSPTTEGRPMAGYGGLFWRGPRSFTGGTILASGGLEGPAVMGQAAPWLAFIGRHDGSGDTSTIVFADHPTNPRYPTKWFVRTEPYACASCSFMFDEILPLAPGDRLDLRYRVIVADGGWAPERIEERIHAHPGNWGGL